MTPGVSPGGLLRDTSTAALLACYNDGVVFQHNLQAYINNLNAAMEKLADAEARGDVNAIVQLQAAIKFNGGGHLNHSIFWKARRDRWSPRCSRYVRDSPRCSSLFCVPRGVCWREREALRKSHYCCCMF